MRSVIKDQLTAAVSTALEALEPLSTALRDELDSLQGDLHTNETTSTLEALEDTIDRLEDAITLLEQML